MIFSLSLSWEASSITLTSLYSSLYQEKPPYKKLQFLADFTENWAPFTENSILTIFTDPIAKKSEIVPDNLSKSQCI